MHAVHDPRDAAPRPPVNEGVCSEQAERRLEEDLSKKQSAEVGRLVADQEVSRGAHMPVHHVPEHLGVALGREEHALRLDGQDQAHISQEEEDEGDIVEAPVQGDDAASHTCPCLP